MLGVRVAVLVVLLLYSCAATAQTPDPAQLFQDAMQAQQQQNFALAAEKYRNLVRLYPGMTAAHANLGIVLVSLGRFDEAIQEYQTALTQVPGNRDLRLNLALAYYKKPDYSKAADEFSSLHSDDPSSVRIATLLGSCYLRLGRDADVVSLLAPLEEANAGDLDLAWALGSALIRTAHAEEGLARVEKVAQQGQSAEAYALAADTYTKLNLIDRARANFDAAVRLNPNLPGLHTLNGTLKDYAGDQDGAVLEFEKALAANPKDFEAELRLGSVLSSQRKWDGARVHLDRALKLDSTSPLARYQMAKVKRAQGELDAAVKDLEKVAHDEPRWLPPHIELAALYYRLKRMEDGAREKQIVDQLTAEEQQRSSDSPVISPTIPSH